ncbi:MAG: orotate phosphoribosyltransferase [Planctomycetes bacterium]|nr:orotate phosphoribosyltransferase [Planctomycetota bacterium]
MKTEQVLELFKKSGAMLEGHFLLSSGRHSDRYFQCALLLAHPKLADELARSLAAKLPQNIDLVIGPAMGAVTWSYEVGRALGLRAFFTERAGAGKEAPMELRRGFKIEPGERVLVVEDVLTTGGSAREVLEVIKKLGGVPVAVASIVNRSGQKNPFEQDGLPYVALAEVKVESWDASGCPLCASKTAGPAIKPGSRPGAAQPA